jgi:hypothetical protein
MRSQQKSQPNGTTVPSSTTNPYGGFYNQMASYPAPPVYPAGYQMYAKPPLPPGPPPS